MNTLCTSCVLVLYYMTSYIIQHVVDNCMCCVYVHLVCWYYTIWHLTSYNMLLITVCVVYMYFSVLVLYYMTSYIIQHVVDNCCVYVLQCFDVDLVNVMLFLMFLCKLYICNVNVSQWFNNWQDRKLKNTDKSSLF